MNSFASSLADYRWKVRAIVAIMTKLLRRRVWSRRAARAIAQFLFPTIKQLPNIALRILFLLEITSVFLSFHPMSVEHALIGHSSLGSLDAPENELVFLV